MSARDDHDDLDELDERASELFRAARSERPSATARERAFGAFAARRTDALAETDSVVPASDEAAPGATQEAARVRRAPFLIAAGFVAAAAATIVIAARHAKSPLAISSEHVPPSARTPAVTSARTVPEPEPETVEVAPPKLRPIGTVHAPRWQRAGEPASSASSESTPVVSPKHVASLSEEVAALDQARQLLASGNTNGALAKLDDYKNVLGGKRLVLEAAVLRIQALSSAGRTAEASRLARRFIEENPGSPLVDRARGFVRE